MRLVVVYTVSFSYTRGNCVTNVESTLIYLNPISG